LRVRRKGDLRFLHGKDHIVFLNLGDKGQQRENKRIKRACPDLLEGNRVLTTGS
jgi:hypothetical protein